MRVRVSAELHLNEDGEDDDGDGGCHKQLLSVDGVR